jgi:hypothetical protein
MSKAGFIRVVSHWCNLRGISIYEIARKRKWFAADVATLFRPEFSPTEKMLQDLAIDPEGEFSTLWEGKPVVLLGEGGETPADIRRTGRRSTDFAGMRLRHCQSRILGRMQPRFTAMNVTLYLLAAVAFVLASYFLFVAVIHARPHQAVHLSPSVSPGGGRK